MGQVGHSAVFFLMVTDLPKYMKSVLKYNIKQSAVLVSMPWIVLWFCGIICGYMTDYVVNHEIFSVICIRKFGTFFSAFFPCVFIILASYMGCNGTAAVVFFTLALFTMGPFYSSLRINQMDISKNFSGIIMALVNGAGALAFAPAPYLIGIIAKDVSAMFTNLILPLHKPFQKFEIL